MDKREQEILVNEMLDMLVEQFITIPEALSVIAVLSGKVIEKLPLKIDIKS